MLYCKPGEGSGPGGGEFDLALGVVGGGEDELGGFGAVRERRFEGGGDGEGCGDARDDLEGEVVLLKEGDLFAGASEDERVSGL